MHEALSHALGARTPPRAGSVRRSRGGAPSRRASAPLSSRPRRRGTRPPSVGGCSRKLQGRLRRSGMDRCNSRLAGISAHLSCPRGSFAAGHTLGGVRATPSAATLPPVFEAAPGLHGLSATERYYFETQGFVVIPDIIPRQLLAGLNTVREIFSSQARAPSNPSALEEGCGLTDCLGRCAATAGCGCVLGQDCAHNSKAQRRRGRSPRRVWERRYWIVHALAGAALPPLPTATDAATDGPHHARLGWAGLPPLQRQWDRDGCRRRGAADARRSAQQRGGRAARRVDLHH